MISTWLILMAVLFCPFVSLGQNELPAKASTAPGLQVTFASSPGNQPSAVDVTVLPNLWLYVPAGKSPTPFLPPGPFTAVWNGFLSLDIRSEYAFQAEVNGEFKLEINGVELLQVSASGGLSAPGKSVRLNKGTNLLTASFRSPPKGDASLRVYWIAKGALAAPLSLNALSHSAASVELRKAAQLRRGRELFAEHRCAKCHATPVSESSMIELSMDAPSFDGIGSRRNSDWMARWILDPKGQRPSAQMPRLFHGAKAKDDAEAVAAYLATLKDGTPPSHSNEVSNEAKEAGKKLFEELHCIACHNRPDEQQADPQRISLKHAAQKFGPGMLAEFLRKPEAHYSWTRMPNFKLSVDEATQLAAFLGANADPSVGQPLPKDAAVLDRGQRLIQSTGCLNCHGLKIENKSTAGSLAELVAARWQQGCLAAVHSENSKAPAFQFSASEREALQVFGETDRSSLGRHVPTDFAERQIRNLNCRECHGKFEGFPQLDLLGEKLKPEWTKSFLAGQVTDKPRPWIEARMPAFIQRAEGLAQGMAMLHGCAPQTAAEAPIDQEAAKVGQKLVSADGGFACVACHAVGKIGATQVFESAGINLAYSGERLLKPFFIRWLYNPLAVDPTTKMPVYFDELGKSPLTDVSDGDGAKQLNALWQYLRLGDKMPPPPGTEAAP